MNTTARRNAPPPTFFWQGLLILLPVGILCGTGVYALVRDRALAEHEATQRAQAIAEDVLAQLWPRLTTVPPGGAEESRCFELNVQGQLIHPPAYTEVPDPRPFDRSLLSPEQSELWQRANPGTASEIPPSDSTETALREFIDSGPPAEFGAVAHFRLGLELLQRGDAPAAAELLRRTWEQYPLAATESGLPLGPLARLKHLEAASGNAAPPPPAELDVVCSNLVYSPGPLTPALLARLRGLLQSAPATGNAAAPPASVAVVDGWLRTWEQHEQLRRRLAQGRAFSQEASWLDTEPDESGAGPWLALPLADRPGWFVCREEREIGQMLSTISGQSRQIPEYFAISLEVGGRTVRRGAPDLRQWGYRDHTARGGSGPLRHVFGQDPLEKEEIGRVLATATRSDPGWGGVRSSVHLTSPAALFQQQRARAFWFGLLLLTAACAAVAGFLAARRAFQRQLRLGAMKSNFVSSVSHELRAPIASVRLMSESLERGTVAEESRRQEYYRFITQECRRLSALVENVLDFSRIEQGRKEYEFEPTDVLELARQTVKLLEPAAREREVRLDLRLPPAEVFATAPCVDGRAVQQALVNLADNALKHSPRGSVVSLGVEKNPARERPLHLWLEDSGPGIPAAEHERIFERFYRCGSELTRQTQGVGIGLSIVKHIAEAHGGRVTVRSAPGEGSRFTLELPMDAREAGALKE